MKTVLVTGAAGGMGRALCRRLIDEGFHVYAIDIKKVDIPEVHSFCCDIRNLEALEEVREKFSLCCPSLDAIVHTAGIYDLDSLTEIEDERFRRIFEINVFGVYRINRLFTPLLKKGGRVTIVTSELAPLDPLPFTGIYAVTKAALEKYAYSLRTELSLRGISVSIIRPGAVNTGLLNVSTSALDKFVDSTEYYKPNADRFKHIVDSVEARSVEPEKIAELIVKSLTDICPRYVYNINRNPLLRILSALPDHMQQLILKGILKK